MIENKEEKFEISYHKRGIEKEIMEWRNKTVKSGKVSHTGADGKLIIEFNDGIVKLYGFNELGFWEE